MFGHGVLVTALESTVVNCLHNNLAILQLLANFAKIKSLSKTWPKVTWASRICQICTHEPKGE